MLLVYSRRGGRTVFRFFFDKLLEPHVTSGRTIPASSPVESTIPDVKPTQLWKVGELASLAKFYVELVRDQLLDHAGRLRFELRRGVLDVIAERLRNVESELSRTASANREHCDELEAMAAATRVSRERLLDMLQVMPG